MVKLLASGVACLLALAEAQGQLPNLLNLPQPVPYTPQQLIPGSASTDAAPLFGASSPPTSTVLMSTVATTVLDQVSQAPAEGRAAIVNTVATAAHATGDDLAKIFTAIFPLYNSVPVYGDALTKASNLITSLYQGTVTPPNVLTQGKSIVTGLANVPGDSRIEFPMEVLPILKTLTPLDSALASHAAVFGLATMGPSVYSTVLRNLAANWNSLGWALPEAAYGPQSFATATKFAAVMNTTSAQYDPTQIAGPFVAGVSDSAKLCVAAFPALSSGTLAQALATGSTACCPLVRKIVETSGTLNSQSGFINTLLQNKDTNTFLKTC